VAPGDLASASHPAASLLAVFVAMAIAVVAGVTITTYLTRPTADTGTVYQESNANAREGRVSTPGQEPNTNPREGRVPGTG
jgi:hypothetical protein